jgi:hypothetical protein
MKTMRSTSITSTSGVTLISRIAPPPMYPEMLGKTLPVGFQCTVQKLCE